MKNTHKCIKDYKKLYKLKTVLNFTHLKAGNATNQTQMKYIITLCSILLFVSCSNKQPQLKVIQGDAFGTRYVIQYYTINEKPIKTGVDSVIARVNQSLSTYIPTSDISKINKGDTTIVVDTMFQEVFTLSKRVFKQSNGYFDPTVGALRNAYGFGETDALPTINTTTLDSLRQFVGFEKVTLENGIINKQTPEIYLDFNAVAKGYGIDEIGSYLDTQQISDYLILLGGEVLAKGQNINKNQAWTGGVEALDSPIEDQQAVAVVFLKNKAMAGSGNYRKFRVDPATGIKYVHTIDPLTGLAQASNVTSATIIAATCAEADAYATACMAMGLEKSKNMLENLPEVDAYLTYTNEANEDGTYITPGFKLQLK